MDNNKRWYMITTISGKEEKVIESLRNRVVSEDLEHIIEDFKIMQVPHLTPKEFEKRNDGEEYKVKQRNLFPGYIFLLMDMTNEAWFIVRNTQYVTGLVGSSGHRAKPTPVSNLEIRKMEKSVEKITTDFHDGKIKTPFIVGTTVEVVDGPAKGQSGTIIENYDERGVSLVEVILFERKTPTEIPHKNLKVK